MKRRLALALLLLPHLAGAAELGRPVLSSEEFARRFTASYGFLSQREPQVTEIEIALLSKVSPMIEASPALARNMIESLLADGKPVSAAFNQVLGNLYYTARLWSEAETNYREAIRKFPDFQRAWNSLGTLLIEQDKYAEAGAALARSIELGANDAHSYGLLGYALLRTRELVAAEVAYDMALLRSPGNIRWLEGKARILSDSGRHAEAIAAARELLQSDPGNVEYWRLQANAHLAQGENDAALRSLEVTRLLGRVNGDTLYLVGNLYAKREMPEQALGAYLAALELEPNRAPTLLLGIARNLLGQNEVELARRLLTTLNPDTGAWSLQELIQHALLQGRVAEHDKDAGGAIAAFERALDLDPLNVECLFRLSQTHADGGARDKARYYLGRIKDDANYEYAAHLFLSRLLIDEGKFIDALAPLRSALRLKPTTELESLYNQVRVAAQISG